MNKYAMNLVALVLVSLPTMLAADTSHLNIDDKELVHLRLTSFGDSVCPISRFGPFREVRSTGLLAVNEFSVPAGKELVITDVYWSGNALNRREWNGGVSEAKLLTYFDTGIVNGTAVELPLVSNPASGISYIGGTLNLTAGAKVASRRFLCAQMLTFELLFNGSTQFGSDEIRKMEIFGYLVDKSL